MERVSSCVFTHTHTAGHVLLSVSPQLLMMSMMDVPLQSLLSEGFECFNV